MRTAATPAWMMTHRTPCTPLGASWACWSPVPLAVVIVYVTLGTCLVNLVTFWDSESCKLHEFSLASRRKSFNAEERAAGFRQSLPCSCLPEWSSSRGLGTVQGAETFFGFQDRNADYVPVSSAWDIQNTYLYRMYLVFLSSRIPTC